jgi:hypothetical protein
VTLLSAHSDIRPVPRALPLFLSHHRREPVVIATSSCEHALVTALRVTDDGLPYPLEERTDTGRIDVRSALSVPDKDAHESVFGSATGRSMSFTAPQ